MILSYYKCRLKLVPEDSVRPETQTLVVIIRRKGFVGGFKHHNKSYNNYDQLKLESNGG
jgi:hypothetical protein